MAQFDVDAGKNAPVVSEKTSDMILINRQIYEGSINTENLFEAICAGFVTSPSNCLFISNRFVQNEVYKQMKEKRERHKIIIYLIDAAVMFTMLAVACVVMYLVLNKMY